MIIQFGTNFKHPFIFKQQLCSNEFHYVRSFYGYDPAIFDILSLVTPLEVVILFG